MHLICVLFGLSISMISITGMQNRFTPEQLGMISSSAFFCIILELIFYWITLYVSNIAASMKFLDLVAFSGYKFVMMNVCVLVSIVFKQFGFYSAWLYTSISIAFFLVCPIQIAKNNENSFVYEKYET